MGPLESSMRAKIEKQLSPVSFDLQNESEEHAGHAAMRGQSSLETHFRLQIVSEVFAGLSRLERQRMVQGLFEEERLTGLHALSLSLKAPSEV